jgi:hypothetical protein
MMVISIEDFKELAGTANTSLLSTAIKLLNIPYSLTMANGMDDILNAGIRLAKTQNWNPDQSVLIHSYLPEDDGSRIWTIAQITSGSPGRPVCMVFNIDTIDALIKALHKIDNIKAFL